MLSLLHNAFLFFLAFTYFLNNIFTFSACVFFIDLRKLLRAGKYEKFSLGQLMTKVKVVFFYYKYSTLLFWNGNLSMLYSIELVIIFINVLEDRYP